MNIDRLMELLFVLWALFGFTVLAVILYLVGRAVYRSWRDRRRAARARSLAQVYDPIRKLNRGGRR